jgi:hypothetical protein
VKALSLAIVGVQHPNRRGPARQFEIAMCTPGEPIELRPEPTNKADPNAVAIYSCRRVQLGYVTAERAPMIRAKLAECGVRAVFQGTSETGAWVRVTFDGSEPIVQSAVPAPSVPPEQERDPDFWPDPVYDDG